MAKTVERHLGIFTRILKIEEHIIDIINDKNPEFIPVVKEFKHDLSNLLLEYEYNRIPKFIDKSQINRSNEKNENTQVLTKNPDSTSMKEEWKKKNLAVKSLEAHGSRAPKRTKKQLPYPKLGPSNEKNRTRQQMKVSLPSNLIKAVNEVMANEGGSRNKWIEGLIEKELKIQYPKLDPDNEKDRTLQQLKVRLPFNLIEGADEASKSKGLSRNAWIEGLIEKKLIIEDPHTLPKNTTLNPAP